MTTTSTYYTPTEGESRFTIGEARAVLDQVVATECPRLVAAHKDISREGMIELDVSGTGAVTRARVTKTVGDDRLDTAFGGIAARLQIDAPPAGTPAGAVGRLRAGYACGAGGQAAVATLAPIE